MDENNPTNGSLFETIQAINKQMQDKINIKLDLRQEPIYQGDDDDGGEDDEEEKSGSGSKKEGINSYQEKQDKKIEGFILKFINLNADNREILDDAKKDLDGILGKRLELIKEQMGINV